MPELGLGLSIDKGNKVPTPLALMERYTSAMWLPSKATGMSEGINAPFTNVISDLKGVVGKNLINESSIKKGVYANDLFPGSEVSAGANNRATYYTEVKPNTQYTFKQYTGQGNFLRITYYDASKTYISGTLYGAVETKTITTPVNCYFIRISPDYIIGQDERIQLELGSVATAYEPYGKANLLLQGFAGTTSSGYVGVLCPNGKTVPFLKFDGTNDYGIANHPSLDITGTGDFAIECVFKTDATIASGYIIFKGLDGVLTSQYLLSSNSDGSMDVRLNGTTHNILTVGTLQPNTLYSLLAYRFNGRLKSRLTKVETYNQVNTTNIAARPHFRVGARTASVDGLTHSAFTNIFLGHLSITNGAITPFTEAELISKFDKFTMQTFGV